MASYSFSSDVVPKKAKYNPEDKFLKNLMHDKRVYRGHIHNMHNIRHLLTPQEQEQLNLQKEKENKQLEMMRQQIDVFKRSRLKQTPYDIRPAPAARIEVDLSYFLTEKKTFKLEETISSTQTDPFLLPHTPLHYVPKKTGVNIATQIWDGDLFAFNEEVAPLLNVLTFKTLEEALEEVEEEAEIAACLQYKTQNRQNNESRQQADSEEVLREIELISAKNQTVQTYRTAQLKTKVLIEKLQNLSLAKTYLERLGQNTLTKVFSENVYPDPSTQLLDTKYIPFLLGKISNYSERDEAVRQLPFTIAQQVCSQLLSGRTARIQQHRKEAAKKAQRDVNFSEKARLVSFLHFNPEYKPVSEFALRLAPALQEIEYQPPKSDEALLSDFQEAQEEESIASSQISESKEKPLPVQERVTLDLKNLGSLSVNLANHPFLDIPKHQRQYGLVCEAYSTEHTLIERLTSSSSIPGITFVSNARDPTHKFSDDERFIINTQKLPEHIEQVLVYVVTCSETPQEYARYHLDHYPTSQVIDFKTLSQSPATCHFAYRIYRHEQNPRLLEVDIDDEENVNVLTPPRTEGWLLDIYNISSDKGLEELSGTLNKVIEEGKEYLAQFTEDLIAYRKSKALEFKEYEKKLKTIEDAAKDKRKKKGKVRMPQAPNEMSKFTPTPYQIPSVSHGPYRIDLGTTDMEELKAKIREDFAEVIAEFDMPTQILVKNKELDNIEQVFKAKLLMDLQVAQESKPVEKEAIQEEEEPVEDEANPIQDLQ